MQRSSHVGFNWEMQKWKKSENLVWLISGVTRNSRWHPKKRHLYLRSDDLYRGIIVSGVPPLGSVGQSAITGKRFWGLSEYFKEIPCNYYPWLRMCPSLTGIIAKRIISHIRTETSLKHWLMAPIQHLLGKLLKWNSQLWTHFDGQSVLSMENSLSFDLWCPVMLGHSILKPGSPWARAMPSWMPGWSGRDGTACLCMWLLGVPQPEGLSLSLLLLIVGRLLSVTLCGCDWMY